jgi:hypothetical protein
MPSRLKPVGVHVVLALPPDVAAKAVAGTASATSISIMRRFIEVTFRFGREPIGPHLVSRRDYAFALDDPMNYRDPKTTLDRVKRA